jgi:hypothetical protein
MKEITGFKIISWFKKASMSVVFGIDAKVDGAWYHLSEDGKPLFFDNRKDALARKRELQKDERERRGIMILRKQEPKGKTLNLH